MRCSSLVDWPVYPRLAHTMLTTTAKRNAIACGCMQASKSAAVLNRLRAMRGPGESYSDVILRLVETGWRVADA
jgi:hypothetical protein